MLVVREPAFLLLLLIPIVMAFVMRRGAARQGATRRVPEMMLRCAALVVLIVATAQPVWQSSTAPRPLAMILDTSDSISAADRATEADWLQHVASQASVADPVPIIPFAGRASAAMLDGPLSRDAALRLVRPRADRNQTNIAGALRLAAGIAPAGARLVLLTDGMQTAGQLEPAVAELAAQHLTLDTVVLSHVQGPDVALTHLGLSPSVPAGADVPLHITVSGTQAMTATLTLQVDGHVLGSQSLSIQAGANPYLVALPAQPPGRHIVRASVRAQGDAVAENNVLMAVMDVARASRVLLVAQGAKTNTAKIVLDDGSLSIVSVTPRTMPASSAALATYDSVVLDDVAATALSGKQVAALDAAVRQRGVGLFVLGGTHSLTLGHYAQSALERMLPVRSDTPASLQDGNVALQLVLDRSGSMDDLAGDVPKIVMSRAAARLAADFTIQHKDDLGMLAFDQASHVLVPMGRVSTADTTHIDRVINGMLSDGGTNIFQALQMGIAQVSRSNAPYHHIILMTDGRSDPADYRPLLREAQQRKITISAVALGPDADIRLLRSIATAGRGRLYYTTNARDLPQIFAEEARLSAGSAAVTGTIGVRIAESSPTIRSLGAGPLPSLGGYTATVLKPDAVNDLATNVQSRQPDPLLARWTYGLGRVLVWTPGLENAWSASWRSAEPTFWADALRWTLRGPSLPAYTPSLLDKWQPDTIQIDTLHNSGTAVDLQRLAIDVRTPNGKSVHLSPMQIGPGLYDAHYAFAGPAVYAVTVRRLTGTATTTSALLAVPYSREYLPASADAATLARIAAEANGSTLHDPRQIAVAQTRTWAPETLWWALALAALVLFMGAVGAGRRARGETHAAR